MKEAEPANADLWVVVPVKLLHRSKQRLSACLGPRRGGLSRAMLEDVLDALEASTLVAGVIVVTRDAEVAELAETRGIRVVEESGAYGMNRAIDQGLAAARRAGARWLVVVPIDIPLLTAREFDRLAHAFFARAPTESRRLVGIVPSADRDGTNWLCVAADQPFVPGYGPASYRRHLEQAGAAGRPVLPLSSPLVSLDIDKREDLSEFLAFCRSHPAFQATRTWRFLRGVGRAGTAEPTPGSYPSDESKYACSES